MKTVLFVCVHNAGRSQMAEAFMNELSMGKIKALSAGTKPADEVNPVVVEAMREVGIDIAGHKPAMLTVELVKQADKMITMGCGDDAGAVCPASFIETEDWALDDPAGRTLPAIRVIRDEIKTRVEKLVKEMNDKGKETD
jgi:protein-tyrosine-phosphatase